MRVHRLPLALYAAAVWRMFRRRCVRVELHHVPTGAVLAHEHTEESLRRKLAEATSIASDLRKADAQYAEQGVDAPPWGPSALPLCRALVRLPCALSGRTTDGAGAVVVGSPGQRRRTGIGEE